ncbi:MAG: hypothetical protein IPN33_12780 [Saprospiraceae bacterium]|nr:hypothetical protein [Saprospiraceae bacterium]
MKNIWLAALVALLSLGACKENPEEYEMTAGERAHIDTLYMKETLVLRPKLDSLCVQRTDSLVRTALDSILKVRRDEEIALRKRIREQGRQGGVIQ